MDLSDLGGNQAAGRPDAFRGRVRVDEIRRAVRSERGRREPVRQRRVGQRRSVRRARYQAGARPPVPAVGRCPRRREPRAGHRDQPCVLADALRRRARRDRPHADARAGAAHDRGRDAARILRAHPGTVVRRRDPPRRRTADSRPRVAPGPADVVVAPGVRPPEARAVHRGGDGRDSDAATRDSRGDASAGESGPEPGSVPGRPVHVRRTRPAVHRVSGTSTHGRCWS